jgi:hypothetical protein
MSVNLLKETQILRQNRIFSIQGQNPALSRWDNRPEPLKVTKFSPNRILILQPTSHCSRFGSHGSLLKMMCKGWTLAS